MTMQRGCRSTDARATLLLAVLLVAFGSPHMAAAQATVQARVVDSETGAPIVGAQVMLRRGSLTLTTDSLGRFETHALPVGSADVNIRMLGYAPGMFTIRVPDAGITHQTFSLDYTGHRLPQVVVRARAEQIMPRYAEFEQRRQRGLGAYLRWDDLTDEKYGSVGDALRIMRGVRVACNQRTFECYAYMSRSPRCRPVWIIDGMEAGMFNESTPIRDIYGIEVYRGPAETPGEFSGASAGCGVIVIWTKSRPYRSTP